MRMHLVISKMLCNCSIFLGIIVRANMADEIFLNSGDNAKTEILDTNGCEVKILRKGNAIFIKKERIQKIIWKTDTISFTGYICIEKPRPVIKVLNYEDTPEYQLITILDNAQTVSQEFKKNARIGFLYAPLQGIYNPKEFAGIAAPLFEIFKKNAKVSALNPSEIISEINAAEHQLDYLFMTKKYHTEIYQTKKRNSLSAPKFYQTSEMISQPEKKERDIYIL